MAHTIKNPKLDSRTARRKLAGGRKPYWVKLREGLHLGYRKPAQRGTAKWIARFYDSERRKYREEVLAAADDTADANGLDVLSYDEAQAKAGQRATEVAAEARGERLGPYTVQTAVDDYFKSREQKGGNPDSDRRRLNLYLHDLADVEVPKLKTDQLRDWLKTIADHPGYTHGGRVRKVPDFKDEEEKDKFWRKRRDSANKTLTLLKAALNHAYREGEVADNGAWTRVEKFQNVGEARPDYLTADEIRRLVNAAQPGLRELVQGALYTGARYGDLSAMNVGDFDPDNGLVMNPNSKGTKSSKSNRAHPVYLTDEAVQFFKRQTSGRKRTEPMFPHPRGGRWGKSDQNRPMRAAIQAAGLDDDGRSISFYTLRHSYISHAVMALIPMFVVARNVGHSDTRMIEKHYGHLARDWEAAQFRDRMPSWDVGDDDGKVTDISEARG